MVGSGAGGGAVAYALAEAGWKVAVLEKGKHYRTSDFYHDEIEICRRMMFVPSALKEPLMVQRHGDTAPRRTSEGWIACCVGGGTVLMTGFFFRMNPIDFRLKSTLGAVPGTQVADWPIDYADMVPFYDRVERVIGVSGTANQNPFEPERAPFPLGPIPTHGAAALIDRACANLGLHAFQTPRAILSAPYDGRQACHQCGFCGSYGCEVEAKSSSRVSFLARAQKTGKLTLRAESMVHEITVDRRGRASGVIYTDAGGARRALRARVVVVACSAIQTARLLLNSGVGNAGGQVGKNLLLSTHVTGQGRFARPHPAWPPGKGLPFIDRSVQNFYKVDSLPYPKAGTILFTRPHPNPIHQAERLAHRDRDQPPLYGAALVERMRRFFRDHHVIEFEAFGEFLPHAGSQVTLDPQVKDRFGLPVARVTVDIHPASLTASDHLGQRGLEILEAAGAKEVSLDADHRTYMLLQAGTARMGHDPETSVCDPTGQVHDTPNLYVADGAALPTTSGAPFTCTIMANGLRVASHIVARGKRIDH